MVEEGEQAVHLDKGVEVRKGKVSRQPDNVRRVAHKVCRDLDNLGDQDPSHHERQQEGLVVRVEVEAGAPESTDKEGIPDDGEADQLGDVDGIHAPGVVAPGVQAAEARRATAPGRPGLAADLSVEGGGVSERREDLCVRGVLDFDLPLVAQHPARDAVVLVHVHGAPEAEEVVLVEVLGAEGFAAEDRGAHGVGASRDDEDAAVEVGL